MLKRILKALFALFFGQVLSRFGSFILVPLFTKYWSPTVYGEWLTLSATVGYIASLDFGVNQAAINKLTQSFAAGSLDEYRKIQHSSLKFYSLAALGGLFIILILLGFLPLNSLLGIVVTNSEETSLTLLFLSLYILTSLPAKIIFGIYQTTGNLSKTQWINNIQNTLFTVVVIFILIDGYGMLYVAVLQYVLQLLAIIYVLIDVKIKYADIFPGLGQSQKKIIKELFKPGLMFTLVLFANIIWMQGSVLLISTTLGGLMVAIFSVTRTLALLPRQIVSIFYAALFPEIAILKGTDQKDKLRIIHQLIIIIPTGLAIVFSSVFCFFGFDIINLWTIGSINPDPLLIQLLLLMILLQTPYLSSAAITLATNEHNTYAILFFLSQLLALVCSLLTINQFGILVIPISFIVSEAFFCYYFVIKDTSIRLSENYNRIFLVTYFNLLLLTSSGLLIAYLFHSFSSLGIVINLIFSFLVISAVVTFYIWKYWLSPGEINFIHQKIKSLKFNL